MGPDSAGPASDKKNVEMISREWAGIGSHQVLLMKIDNSFRSVTCDTSVNRRAVTTVTQTRCMSLHRPCQAQDGFRH